jgi:hypothetical protein
MEQVGPQLGFHDHDALRPHPVEKARDDTGQVVGRVNVEHLVSQGFAHARRARGRGRRHQHATGAVTLDQCPDQRQRRERFADRDGVHPDRDRLLLPRHEAEALADAPPVGRQLAGSPQQAQQHERSEQIEQQCVEGAHRGEAAGSPSVLVVPCRT